MPIPFRKSIKPLKSGSTNYSNPRLNAFERQTQKGNVAEEGRITKWQEETFGGDKYIHYPVLWC